MPGSGRNVPHSRDREDAEVTPRCLPVPIVLASGAKSALLFGCSPLFTESFNFLVPHPFSRLTFYLCDADCTVLRDQRFGQVNLTAESLASGYEVGKEQWLPIRAVTANSEVQVS